VQARHEDAQRGLGGSPSSEAGGGWRSRRTAYYALLRQSGLAGATGRARVVCVMYSLQYGQISAAAGETAGRAEDCADTKRGSSAKRKLTTATERAEAQPVGAPGKHENSTRACIKRARKSRSMYRGAQRRER